MLFPVVIGLGAAGLAYLILGKKSNNVISQPQLPPTPSGPSSPAWAKDPIKGPIANTPDWAKQVDAGMPKPSEGSIWETSNANAIAEEEQRRRDNVKDASYAFSVPGTLAAKAVQNYASNSAETSGMDALTGSAEGALGYVNTAKDPLALRSVASTGGTVLKWMPPKEPLIIFWNNYSADGSWVKVQSGNLTGWAYKQFVKNK